jgi:hypothetical protein
MAKPHRDSNLGYSMASDNRSADSNLGYYTIHDFDLGY